MTNSFLVVPVGSSLSRETWALRPGFRTAAQFAAVAEIVSRPEFAFSCGSRVFEPETGRPYRGPVTFTWYDRSGTLHADRVGGRGLLLASVTA